MIKASNSMVKESLNNKKYAYISKLYNSGSEEVFMLCCVWSVLFVRLLKIGIGLKLSKRGYKENEENKMD